MNVKVDQFEAESAPLASNEIAPDSGDTLTLLEGAMSGDLEAFARLCQDYLDRVYRYVFYQVKDKETAEELTTEICLDAYKQIASYQKSLDFPIWLYRIAHDYMREDPRFNSSLPFLERQVVLLKFVQGLSNREISQVIRQKQSNIHYIQVRALSFLNQNRQIEGGKLDKGLSETLDICFARITGGEPVERCLFKYAKRRRQLEPLLNIGLKIAASAQVSMAKEFKIGFQADLTRRLRNVKVKQARAKSKLEPESKQEESKPGFEPPMEQSNSQSSTVETGPGIMGATVRKILNPFRQSKVLAIAAVAILLIIVGSVFLMTGSIGLISSLLPSSPVSASTLTITSGSVDLQTAGETTWRKATDNMAIKEGTRLRTSDTSSASIKFAEGSKLNLASNTDIEIDQAKFVEGGSSGVIMKQNAGKSTSQVVKLATPDSRYEIQTPSALISVKGTQFVTEVEQNGTTRIKVDQGTVTVTAQGKDVSVNAGYQVTVESGKPPGEPVSSAATPTPSGKTATPTSAYTLVRKSSKGGSISRPTESTASFAAGSVVDLAAIPDSGYAFSGWTGDITNLADSKAASTTLTIKGNTTIMANFVQTYVLTIRTRGGSIVKPGESTHAYAAGSVVELSAKPDNGYIFVNWTGDTASVADPKSAETTITIKANSTITANFIYLYKLTVKSVTGGWVLKPGEGIFSYNDGTSLDLLAVPDSGYLFAGWTCDGNTIADSSAASTKIIMNKDATLTPKFIKTDKLYTLTTKAAAGGQVSRPGQGTFSCKEGTAVDLSAVPATGYGFLRWTGDSTTVANVFTANTTILMKGNYSLTANFIQTFTLTVGTSSGGTVAQPGGVSYIYNSGSVVPLLAIASPEFSFINWTGDIAGIADANSAATTIIMTANASVTANFARTYNLTVATTAGGTVYPPGVGTFSYKEGAVVNITAVADAGYTFVNWIGDITTVTKPEASNTTISIRENYSITANFTQAGVLHGQDLHRPTAVYVKTVDEEKIDHTDATSNLRGVLCNRCSLICWLSNPGSVSDGLRLVRDLPQRYVSAIAPFFRRHNLIISYKYKLVSKPGTNL